MRKTKVKVEIALKDISALPFMSMLSMAGHALALGIAKIEARIAANGRDGIKNDKISSAENDAIPGNYYEPDYALLDTGHPHAETLSETTHPTDNTALNTSYPTDVPILDADIADISLRSGASGPGNSDNGVDGADGAGAAAASVGGHPPTRRNGLRAGKPLRFRIGKKR